MDRRPTSLHDEECPYWRSSVQRPPNPVKLLSTLLFSISSATGFNALRRGLSLSLRGRCLSQTENFVLSIGQDLKGQKWIRSCIQAEMMGFSSVKVKGLEKSSVRRPAKVLPMEGIQNFRQVSSSLPGIYRSGALEQATAADAAKLLDAARIRTIVDIRSLAEIEKAHSSSTYFGRALLRAFDTGSEVGPGRVASEGLGPLKRMHIPLVRDTKDCFEKVASRISPLSKARAAALRMFDAKAADGIVYEEVSSGKQDILNKALLGRTIELSYILQVIANARSNGAVLVHSSQGKDRTGVVAALLQHVAKDSEELIIEQYAASERLLQYANMQGEADSTDIEWNAWRGSPPQAMAKTLKWLKSKYLVTDNFLRSIGCEPYWERTLLRHVELED